MHRRSKSTESENRLVAAWGRGDVARVTANRQEFSFWNNGNILKLGHSNGCTILKTY
jgi:hypothetical protein